MRSRVMGSMLVFLFACGAFAQLTNTLSGLTDKYVGARQKIETDSVSAYTNALAVAGAQLKQKADLDGYLALQEEQKRMAEKPDVEGGLTNGCKVVSDLAQKAVDEKNAKTAGFLKQHVVQLEALLKQMMVADKIDEAKQTKEALDAAKAELVGLESKAPKVEEKPKAKTNEVSKAAAKTPVATKGELVIVKATYGTTDGSKFFDVTEKLQAMVKDGKLVMKDVKSNDYNSIFGSPQGGVRKVLKVQYKLNGNMKEVTAQQDTDLTIP